MRLKYYVLILFVSAQPLTSLANEPLWLEISANNVKERTALATQGYDIVAVEHDRVIVLGSESQLHEMQSAQKLLASYPRGLSPFDFPA